MVATVEDIAAKVNFVLGYPSEDILPQAALTLIITNYLPYYPLETKECELTYFSCVAAVDFIIRKLGGNGSGLGGSRLREKEGNIEYEEAYSSGNGVVEFWKSELKRFKADPSVLLPCLKDLPITLTPNSGYLLFGGVSKEEVGRVDSDGDSFSVFDETFEDYEVPIKRLLG